MQVVEEVERPGMMYVRDLRKERRWGEGDVKGAPCVHLPQLL